MSWCNYCANNVNPLSQCLLALFPMLQLTISALTAVLLLPICHAQTPNCPGTFDACLSSVALTWGSADGYCPQIQQRNATYYIQCLCYWEVDKDRCYDQCSDPAVRATRVANMPTLTNACQQAGLNPLALPPAAWVAAPLPASKSAAVATSAQATQTAPAAKSGAISDASTYLAAILAMAF